jgi:hypothetical protein
MVVMVVMVVMMMSTRHNAEYSRDDVMMVMVVMMMTELDRHLGYLGRRCLAEARVVSL